MGVLRQAFRNQDDGQTRVEALTSLLLSEHHRQAEGWDSATVAQSFLSSREALCLDADVTAAASNVIVKGENVRRDGFAADIHTQQSSSSTQGGDRGGAQHRKHRRHCKRTSAVLGGEGRGERMNHSGESDQQGDGSDWGEFNGNCEGSSLSDSGEGLFSDSGEQSLADLTASLSLAATVSILDGFRGNTAEYEQLFRYEESLANSRRDHLLAQEISGTEVLEAVWRAKIPLLMVQSTEDALIGTPFPMILEAKVRLEISSRLLRSTSANNSR